MSALVKMIICLCVSTSLVNSNPLTYESKVAHPIPIGKKMFFGVILFSNGKETVAFQSEKALMQLLYGKIPKKEETSKIKIDWKNISDMKSVPFSRNSFEILKPSNKPFAFYIGNKNYTSELYFLDLSAKDTKFFVYKLQAKAKRL